MRPDYLQTVIGAGEYTIQASGNTSFTGGTMVQNTSTGISLDAGDAPTWWVDVAGPPPQQIRPDADNAAGTWTTAPLWSKLDESVADDGDFITETAS